LTDVAAAAGVREAVSASAPGRVNLIGEHTDYNGGYVLPMALSLRTDVRLTLRDDNVVHAVSGSLPPAQAEVSYRRGDERRTGGWIDYVQGVTQALDERGLRVPGFELEVQSSVPVGGGLASSAALEVAVVRALRAACELPLSDVDVAMVAHRAETQLVGAPVGVMDQMASSLAHEHEALFLDARSLVSERVPLPAGAAIAIIDSGITHSHSSGEYRVRRAECAEAAALLGVALLRDVSENDMDRINRLPSPLDRRVRHVVRENARVLAAVRAMRAGALEELGALWTASHASMRDDFETSLPEIDALAAIAQRDAAVYGARLTGGGFGGAVVVLCRADLVRAGAHRILSAYHEQTGKPGRVLVPSDPP
jgi:galactokinase